MLLRIIPQMRLTLRRFRKNEGGNMTIEAAFLMPVMVISVVIMYLIFDAIRQHAVNQKAAYVISDMLSRETDYIDPDYMRRARQMLKFMTSQHKRDITLRVSVLRYDAEKEKYEVQWSKKRGPVPPLKNRDMSAMEAKLPALSHFEEVVIVESWVEYDPPLNLGFLPREIRTMVFNRMRFTPQLLWSGNGRDRDNVSDGDSGHGSS